MIQRAPQTDLDSSAAVARALAQLPPLFPLSQFVAVNPFLGLSDQSFEAAAERLHSLHGRAPLLSAAEYQRLFDSGEIGREALERAGAPNYSAEQLLYALHEPIEQSREAVMTAVDALEIELEGRGYGRLVLEEISKWCATCFDENQTTWRSPWAKSGLYRAFVEGAVHDATLELNGVPGFRSFVSELPADASRAVTDLLRELAPASELLENFVHRQLALVSGWAGFCRYLAREQELRGSSHPALQELLAVRLAYDVALLRAYPSLRVLVGTPRRRVQREVPLSVLCRWQAAYEMSWQQQLARKLHTLPATAARPDVQAVFCIDVRSEPLRRHLEATSSGVQTLGFAGFFGFAVGHRRADGSGTDVRCPALLVPACESADAGLIVHEAPRARRERASTWKAIQNAAASCFSFVETLGIGRAAGLWSLADHAPPAWRNKPSPKLLQDDASTLTALVDRAAGMLRNMSLTHHFGRLLLLCGHGSHSANNPYASALDCGACGGHAGDVNARLAAQALNRSDVRAQLEGRGLLIPGDTWVLAGLHDTVTDEVELFDLEFVPESHRQDVAALQAKLRVASEATRQERAAGSGLTPKQATLRSLRRRAQHIAETRPEWGLAGNAALIVARRSLTRERSLEGRCFLHEYRHEEDPDGSVLALILAAPVVVASWINLQYYASRVDPERYGSGNKVLHNVVGGIGVFEGNGGDLRVGLPLQSIHDGQRFVHEPRRLSVFIEAPREKLRLALAALPEVQKLFDGGWLHLLAVDGGRIYTYTKGGFRELPPTRSGEGLAA
jgi:uncharacterized protein YbcC (UPF0753/DUF2309 family)